MTAACPSAPLIGIWFPTSSPWLRYVFNGVAEYAARHTDWRFAFRPKIGPIPAYGDPDFRVAGVIDVEPNRPCDVPPEGFPCVWLKPPRTPLVFSDQPGIGRMACAHLLERGFRHLLVFNTFEAHIQDYHERATAFESLARASGVETTVFAEGPRTRARGEWRMEDQVRDLAEVLQTLPRPFGLMAVDPDHTERALVACGRAGLAVPGDVAVVSCADDDIVFSHTRPSISAVVHDQRRIGWEAARILHARLRGEAVPDTTLVPPRMVMARESTDRRAVSDPLCAKVLHYIRDHVGEGIRVGDLAREFHMSERTLLRHFEKHLGHGPANEIATARLETAKRLLLTTERPLIDVALSAGYGGQPQFQRAIKADTGLTPLELRRRHGTGL